MFGNPFSRGNLRWVCSQAILAGLVGCWIDSTVAAVDNPPEKLELHEDFERGADRWQPTDAAAWKIVETDRGKSFAQFQQSKFSPPHRSPLNFALLKDVDLTDFTLEAKVKSTVRDYGHRDACLVFCYQNPAHFYYVHLGKQTDDHANQIFIVNDAPRTKISTKTTPGTPWTDSWHHVKLVRRAAEGAVEVYFDNMKTPVMTAKDKTFAHGQIGLGTFDDTSEWDDVRVDGLRLK